MFIEEEFPFSLPYLCQQRFSQLLNLKTALNFSKCNHPTNSLVQKAVGKIGKLLISNDFKPQKTNSIIPFVDSNDYCIHDLPCYGITYYDFRETFTTDTLDLFPVWEHPMEITIKVKRIMENAFVQLIYSNISSLKFRGDIWCLSGRSVKLGKILFRLSKIDFVEVKFEDFLITEKAREEVLVTSKHFPKLGFEFYKSDLLIRTMAPMC